MGIRLLGDGVLRQTAWKIADRLGLGVDLRRRVRRAHPAAGATTWSRSTTTLARAVEGVVATAPFDALFDALFDATS